MTEWFKKWFSSDEYLTVYSHRNERDAENLIKLILNYTNLPKKARILDAACGAGRHSLLLAQKGFKVTAFDLSRNLLRIGKQNSTELEIDVDFICSDLRKTFFRTRFSLIMNMFTSFGYFKDDADNFAFFKNAIDFLDKDGFVVLDYLNKSNLENNLIPYSMKKMNEKTFIETRRIENSFVIKEIEIKQNGHTKTFTESVKLYENEELLTNFQNLGYIPVEIFGSYMGDEFDKEESERTIIIFRR